MVASQSMTVFTFIQYFRGSMRRFGIWSIYLFARLLDIPRFPHWWETFFTWQLCSTGHNMIYNIIQKHVYRKNSQIQVWSFIVEILNSTLSLYLAPLDLTDPCSCINPIIYGVYYFSERNSTIIGHRNNPAHRWEPQLLTKDLDHPAEASCTLHPFKQAEVAMVKQEHLQFCTGYCSNPMYNRIFFVTYPPKKINYERTYRW